MYKIITQMKKYILWLLSWLVIAFIWLCIDVYVDIRMVWEEITCDYRYVWWSYKWTVLAQKWDYIYLSWTSEVRLDCTIVEDEVDENTPLCWTYIPFNWPLDTSNMNCYKGDKDIEWKLAAFKEQEEQAKKEEDKYYTCNINSDEIIKMYNSCETVACAQNRLRNYFEQQCPRAIVK